MDQSQIQAMIKTHFQQVLDDDMDYRINRDPLESMENPYTDMDVTHEPELMILDELKSRALDQLVRSDYSEVREQALELVKDQNASAEDVNEVCHGLLRALPAYYDVLRDRAVGNFQDHTQDLQGKPRDPSEPRGAVSEPGDPPLTIGQLAANYWQDRSSEWKPRSKTGYRRAREKLLEYLGKDTPVTSINYEVMKGYRKSVQDSGLSISSINFHVGFASAIFNHEMKTTGLLRINPASGLKIKDKRRKDTLRDAFSLEDLGKLFVDGPGYKDDQLKSPAHFWVPLISLYSGCRLEEACQLYTDQIRKIGDTWCMVIDEEHDDQSVKSSEKREVPLHPFLLKLGLHRYAQEQTTERLWPELRRQNHRYGHYIGRQFGKYKTDCGLGDKVSFHSFRGTIETALMEKDVDPVWIDILVGHAVQGEGRGRYLDRKPRLIFDKTVSKLAWDQKLDLSALANSKFARP